MICTEVFFSPAVCFKTEMTCTRSTEFKLLLTYKYTYNPSSKISPITPSRSDPDISTSIDITMTINKIDFKFWISNVKRVRLKSFIFNGSVFFESTL